MPVDPKLPPFNPNCQDPLDPPSYLEHINQASGRPNIEAGKKVATYDGRPVVELASGRKLVVYDTNASQGKVIAFPYGPWYTFRQAQYWAVAAFSALSATGLGVGLSLYSVTPPGLIAVAVTGVALFVLGVGIGLVRYFNTSDPAAKREAREHAVMAKKVQSGTLLSPTEARTFAFDSARFTTAESLHSKKSDIDYLGRSGLIDGDEQGHLRGFFQIDGVLRELENEREEKLAPARARLSSNKRKADRRFEGNSAVLIHRAAAATAMATAPTGKKDEGRNSARSAVHTGATITQAATLPAVMAAERERHEEKMSAHAQYAQEEKNILDRMNFSRRLDQILRDAHQSFRTACERINPTDPRFSRSNVDHDFRGTSASILAALREPGIEQNRSAGNVSTAPSAPPALPEVAARDLGHGYAPSAPPLPPVPPYLEYPQYVPGAPSAPVYSPLPATAPTHA